MLKKQNRGSGFTLIELLVVVAIISLLTAILLPSLAKARQMTRKLVCQANIRALQVANEMYQTESGGWYAPAAKKFIGPAATNLHRWFGTRNSVSEPFSESGGSLSGYLPGTAVRNCPDFVDFTPGFETGCGGYGYNNHYVGTHTKRENGLHKLIDDASGNWADIFRRPSETISFADAAFVDDGLTEYSFLEPPKWGWSENAYDESAPPEARPTIHFRHGKKVNVVWLDTHVSEETLSFSSDVATGYYGGRPIDFDVGWFGPNTIELFDLD